MTRTANPYMGLQDQAFRGLEQANVHGVGDVPNDPNLVHVQNVPVFAEHETQAKDGRQLKFGRAELQAVANRCNRRITENGDYAGLCIGHTPGPDEPHRDVPLIGFAGPFKVGQIGQDGQRQRYAILADFHLHKEHADKLKQFPRRSPEVWLEDTFDEIFLDPIALLGGSAPRLDMGLLYAGEQSGRHVERYAAAAAASAFNTFVPSHGDKQTTNYQSGEGPMLSPEDIQQLLQAFMQTDAMVWVQSQMQESQGANMSGGMPPVGPPMGADPLGEAPPPMEGAPMGDAPPDPSMNDPMAPPPAAPGGPGLPPPDAGAAPGAPMPPMAKEPEPMQRYAKDDAGAANTTGELQTADQHPDMGGTKNDMDPIGTPKMDYAADYDDMGDDDFEKYAAGFGDYAKQRSGRRKKKYAADISKEPGEGKEGGSMDGRNSETPSDSTIEPPNPAPESGDGSVSDTDGEATGEYQEATPPKKYRKEGERELYELREQLAGMQKQIETERGARTNAERSSVLSDRRQYFTFDLEREQEICRFAKMSDAQFAEHVETIETNYARIPLGMPTPVVGLSKGGNGQTSDPSNAAVVERYQGHRPVMTEKYSKEISDQAKAICEAKAIAGETPDYKLVVEALSRGETVPA